MKRRVRGVVFCGVKWFDSARHFCEDRGAWPGWAGGAGQCKRGGRR